MIIMPVLPPPFLPSIFCRICHQILQMFLHKWFYVILASDFERAALTPDLAPALALTQDLVHKFLKMIEQWIKQYFLLLIMFR